MSFCRRRLASEVGVKPALVVGLEAHGLCYFTWPDSCAVGAQCQACHSIVWVDSRSNAVLTEKRQKNVPASGDLYRAYYEKK